jgi:hypothetical protein
VHWPPNAAAPSGLLVVQNAGFMQEMQGAPQVCVPPAPSETVPHVRPAHATSLDIGITQPWGVFVHRSPAVQHGLRVFLPHAVPLVHCASSQKPPFVLLQPAHVPQLIVPPQPLLTVPHVNVPHASAAVFGTHTASGIVSDWIVQRLPASFAPTGPQT